MNLKTIRQRAIFELNKAGIKSAAIDVDILLQNVIRKDDVFLFSNPDFPLTNSQYQKFRRLVRKRKTGLPIAYIVGQKEFYGLNFIVNKNVLIPRPETELLVEQAIQNIENRISKIEKQPTNSQPLTIIDIGTGSGNITISIMKRLSDEFIVRNSEFDIQAIATDISEKALKIAKQNAKKHNLKSIKFYKSDLFSNKRLPKYYDVILANLPYVPKAKRQTSNPKLKNEIFYEPQDAIFADNNGTMIIRKLLDQVKNKLNEDSIIILEADPRNIKEIKQCALKYFDKKVEIIKDLSSHERFLQISN